MASGIPVEFRERVPPILANVLQPSHHRKRDIERGREQVSERRESGGKKRRSRKKFKQTQH